MNKEDGSSWSDSGDDINPDLQAQLNAQIARSLGLNVHEPVQTVGKSDPKDHTSTTDSANPAQDSHKEQGDENSDDDLGEFEFRLFSAPDAPSKVVLEDEQAPLGEGALENQRPLSHYLVRDVSESKKREYLAAAVSGEDIVERSMWRSWGMEMPWKVTRILVAKKSKRDEGERMQGVVEGGEDVKKRRRPGKKTRIAVRMKVKAGKERAEVDAKKAVDKEEHLKEKKKRMNRLKKLRKRAKKKAGKDGDGDGDGDESGGESGGE